MSYVKHLVSKKKRRFIEDGFDLDLTYIKPNIVAMGFPSEKLEGVYRNNIDEVLRFLETKHKDHYKIYNLCSERKYDHAKFNFRVSHYPFDDHSAPPFELIEPYCKDMDEFLNANSKNVAIVHCKAGKGRTGVMICSYLLHKNHFMSTHDAMKYYGEARTRNSKGVTIPSQQRYIEYYGHYVRNGLKYEKTPILLKAIRLDGIPNFNSNSCSPYFIIWQTKVKLYQSKVYEVKRNEQDIRFALPSLPLCGDIKIEFFHKDRFTKERMFLLWFNTFFLRLGYTPDHPDGGGEASMENRTSEGDVVRYFYVYKEDLDKANKDKKHKLFPPNFKIRFTIVLPNSAATMKNQNGSASSSSSSSTDGAPPNKPPPNETDSKSMNNFDDEDLSDTDDEDEWATPRYTAV